MLFLLIQTLASPVIDLYCFYKISKQRIVRSDLEIFILFFLLSFIDANGFINDFVVNFCEAIILFLYFKFIRKYKNGYVLFGIIILIELIDLLSATLVSIWYAQSLSITGSYLIMLIIDFLICILINKLRQRILSLLSNSNNSIFIGLISYIYLSTTIVYFFILKESQMTIVFEVSVALLILQIGFAVFAYTTVVRIQKNMLTKQEQQRQKLELKLTEAQNKELVLKQKQLKTEMSQLQEYTSYLDKNEDELRRFKHDYQNILTSLKVSAKEGNTEAVIDQLDQYTKTQFDQKALRKYKGINHIHEKNLKSIAIAKLTKLYSLNINYSFGCEKDINHIPQGIDIFDLVRIIGIAFDNAIEESRALIKETGDPNVAQVDAMYYQENGNFEFEIRNRVRKENIDSTVISQKNYTTKKHHMGLGLANVKEIAHKYNDNLLINYDVQDGWFDFDLLILPSESEEQE